MQALQSPYIYTLDTPGLPCYAVPMSQSHRTPVLTPARTGAQGNNPNRAKGRVGRMTPPARLTDGVRHPVRVTWAHGRYSAERTLGTLPRVKTRRAQWTAERILALAIRAENEGRALLANELLACAERVEARL